MVAIVTGSTGLIGGQLIELLLADGRFTEIHALVRRKTGLSHTKYREHVVDFEQLDIFAALPRADVAFCCLGSTMKKAGSKEAFYKIDYHYALSFGKLAKYLGCKKFLLVSAMGAHKSSAFFYSRVKGEIEEALAALGFEALHIMRPSLLLGNRSEARMGEDVGKALNSLFGWMLPEAYRGVEGRQVAKMMAHLATGSQTGTHIHTSDRIRAFGPK